ncbi:MAG: DMT family transporter [Myxococcota bacterium]
MSSPRGGSFALALGGAMTAVSSAALVILLAQPLPPSVIAAGRVAVTGGALMVVGTRAWPSAWAALRTGDVRWRVLAAAVLLAVHFGTWVTSLTMTSVARSVTLVATQPLFAGLLAWLGGQRVPRSWWAGAVVAIAGTVVMVSEDGPLGGGFGIGDGLALIAAAAATGYFMIGRSVRSMVPLRPYLGLVHLVAAAILAGLAWVMEPVPFPASATGLDWLALVYLGLVPGLVGHGLLNWAVRQIPVYVVSLVILLEPVGATLLTLGVLGRSVTPAEALGGGILLVGVALGIPRRQAEPT